MAEVQERRRTELISQVLFKLWLTSYLPLSHWPEQVAWPSPEWEKEGTAEDTAKDVGAAEDRYRDHFAVYYTGLSKPWPALGASFPVLFYLDHICFVGYLRAFNEISSEKQLQSQKYSFCWHIISMPAWDSMFTLLEAHKKLSSYFKSPESLHRPQRWGGPITEMIDEQEL